MISGRTEFFRIVSNYLRLICTFLSGALIVRLIIGFGDEAFSIYALITVGIGIGVMLKELLRISLVPPLTKAYSNKRQDQIFVKTYASAWVISVSAAVFGIAVFSLVVALVQVFSIAPEFLDAARIFVACRAVQMIVVVLPSPLFNLLLATQRQVQYNILLTCERIAELLAVLVALYFAPADPASKLIWIGISATAFVSCLYAMASFYIFGLDESFRPKVVHIKKLVAKEILSKLGWGSAVVVSMNLYLRIDILIVNIFFGSAGTVVFGVAVQVIGYLRQLTTGIVTGLDAVLASIANKEKGVDHVSLQANLIWLASSLQAIVVVFALGYIWLVLEDIVYLWIGDILQDANTAIPTIVALSMTMVLAIFVRSLSEAWMQAMAGLGRIDAYARWLLPTALMNPILVYIAHLQLPDFNIMTIAWIFVCLQVFAHGLILPFVASRITGISLFELLIPFLLPTLTGLITTIVAYLSISSISFESAFAKVLLATLIFSLGACTALYILAIQWQRRVKVA